jgi:predicted ATPase with chaperone activity
MLRAPDNLRQSISVGNARGFPCLIGWSMNWRAYSGSALTSKRSNAGAAGVDMEQIRGQRTARRPLEVAAT